TGEGHSWVLPSYCANPPLRGAVSSSWRSLYSGGCPLLPPTHGWGWACCCTVYMEVLLARMKTTEGWSGQTKSSSTCRCFCRWMDGLRETGVAHRRQIPSATTVEKGPSR
ncbi:unnamed protein product, partial [Ectocarpus sp. 6 AP-2014]